LKLDRAIKAATVGLKLNNKYKGEITDWNIHQESGNVGEENCSLHITRIPPEATSKEILDTVRSVLDLSCSYDKFCNLIDIFLEQIADALQGEYWRHLQLS
jgi:hypothetical protein